MDKRIFRLTRAVAMFLFQYIVVIQIGKCGHGTFRSMEHLLLDGIEGVTHRFRLLDYCKVTFHGKGRRFVMDKQNGDCSCQGELFW